MSENTSGSRSDLRAIGLCLLHIGILFVPVAVCMLLLAGLSLEKPSSAPIDPIQTGSTGSR